MNEQSFQLHFTEESYYVRKSDGQRLLRSNAEPTIFAHKPEAVRRRPLIRVSAPNKSDETATLTDYREPAATDRAPADHDHTYNGGINSHKNFECAGTEFSTW